MRPGLVWSQSAMLAFALAVGVTAMAAPAATPALTPPVTPAAAAPAPGEPPVTLNVKPAFSKPVRIGDSALFQVTLDAASLEGVGSPQYGEKIGPWDVLHVSEGTWQRAANGHYTRRDQLTLTTFEPGEVAFPAIVLKFKTAEGKEGEFRSAAFQVKVDPLPAKPGDKPGQLRGLKPPIGMIPLWLVVAVALLLAAAATMIWRFERGRRAAGEDGGSAPARPAEVVARERLAALRSAPWLAQGEMKPYYSELADILRRYLEARCRIPASDRTTAELIRELKSASLKRTDLLEIREVLDASDMAKFAKAKPSAKEAETHWQTVHDLVERTTAVAAAAATTDAGGAA